jgi:translocation and assembly module TamA
MLMIFPIIVGSLGPTIAFAAEASPPAAADATAKTTLEVPYEVSVEAAGDEQDLPDGLEKPLQQASLSVRLQDDPPATVMGLRRRADGDAPRLLEVLTSAGYYGGSVQPVVDSRESPAQVTLRVKAGTLYTYGTLTVDYGSRGEEAAQAGLPQGAADLGVTTGQAAEAGPMLDAVDQLEKALEDSGYPAAAVTKKRFVVDHQTRTLSAQLTVDLGPKTTYGAVSYHGLETVDEAYLRRALPLEEGDPWNQQQVEDYRRSLLNEGLFDSVTIKGEPLDGQGESEVRVEATESEHRTLGAGASYSTTLGASTRAYWEHRNLLGQNEDFRTTAELGMTRSALSASLRKPHLWERNQTWISEGSLSDSRYEAYDETALTLSTGLERPLSDHWRGSLGVTFEQSEITDVTGEKASSMLGFPLILNYDHTDSRLDPRSGVRLTFSGTPYSGYYEGPVAFVSVRGDVSAYLPLDEDKRVVLAGRVSAGSLLGASRSGIPANRRFYAGGGGSVRGYGYQMAGPLDAEGDPAGGKALLETGFEVRWKVTEEIEVVPFIEGGRAFESASISGDEKMFWGAGLGFRYHTAIGPLRVDFAVPLDQRTNIDDPWQFYVSLGQAF